MQKGKKEKQKRDGNYRQRGREVAHHVLSILHETRKGEERKGT